MEIQKNSKPEEPLAKRHQIVSSVIPAKAGIQ